MRFSIRKLLGSKQAESGREVVLGFSSPEGEVEASIDPNMLLPLALEVLNARSTWERVQSPGANSDLHALIVERWEIRRSTQKRGLLLSLKVTGDAWVRFEIPRDAIAAMHETIEVSDGRRPPPSTQKRKN